MGGMSEVAAQLRLKAGGRRPPSRARAGMPCTMRLADMYHAQDDRRRNGIGCIKPRRISIFEALRRFRPADDGALQATGKAR
jgi:hypothetical protein